MRLPGLTADKMAVSRKRLAIIIAVCVTVLVSVTSVAVYFESRLHPQTRHAHQSKSVDYMTERKDLIAKDTVNRTGQNIVLTDDEKKANKILMGWKLKEMNEAFASGVFIGSESFITAKPKIEQSQVFKIIKKMPKGAILHLHDLAMADFKWLIKNITTMDICFMCYNKRTKLVQFKISLITPNSTSECEWISTPIARNNSGDAEKFDQDLYLNLTMTKDDPKKLYPTQNALWVKFGGIFAILSGLLGFEDAFAGYYRKGLEELKDDNIQYAEVRSLMIPLYDANGNTYTDPTYSLNVYKKVTEEFVTKYPKDFHGARMIYIKTRNSKQDDMVAAVNKAILMKKKYPEIMAGFDLVGQEDTGYSLIHYLDALLIPRNTGADLPYYFHAGETNWEGSSVDYNLVDALLLKTKRIGHGFALTKHQTLMKEARFKNVAAEVCPISNQILGLVSDMRNHPATAFLDQDFPMTVNSDDPPIWGSTGLSHDFYQVFMGMTRFDDDIRVLKQLAINSIRYSSLQSDEKAKLQTMWSYKWDQFINIINTQFSPPA